MNKYYTVFVLHHQWWCVLHSSTTTPYTNASVNGSNLSPKIHQSFHDIPHPCPQNTLSPPKFTESIPGMLSSFLSLLSLAWISFPWYQFSEPQPAPALQSPWACLPLPLSLPPPSLTPPLKFTKTPTIAFNSRIEFLSLMATQQTLAVNTSLAIVSSPAAPDSCIHAGQWTTLAHDHVTLSEK